MPQAKRCNIRLAIKEKMEQNCTFHIKCEIGANFL